MGFTEDLTRAIAKLQKQTEMAVRETALELVAGMIEKSPVGNPDLWKANADVQAAKAKYLDVAIAHNEANPGKRRMGTGKQTLNKKFKNRVGQGYVGGRFKSNWMVSIGSINLANGAEPGANALLRAKADTAQFELGDVIWISNNLPYAKRLEFEGWSKQAPAGMARLTMQDADQILKRAVQRAKLG